MSRYLGSLFALVAIAVASPPVAAASSVPEGYRHVAAAHGIPSELFYAVALAESGKQISHLRTTRPWPWTLNIQGEGRYFPSREEAVVAAQEALAKGRRSIDIGLMQVNWGYHRTALRSVEAAIDPYHNLAVGAGILPSASGCGATGGRPSAAITRPAMPTARHATASGSSASGPVSRRSGSARMRRARVAKFFLTALGLWSGFAVAELAVVYDSGATAPLAPYLEAFSELAPEPPVETQRSDSLGAADLSGLLPIRSRR